MNLYSSIPSGTLVVAVGCTYTDARGTTLNAGPPARTMGETWRARGAVPLEGESNLPPFSDDPIEVEGIWTGSTIRLETWRNKRLAVGDGPVGPMTPVNFAIELAKSLSETGESEVLGHLTDSADTRNLITVALLTDKWKAWADLWKETAVVQVQGFICPVGGQRIYPELPPLSSPL